MSSTHNYLSDLSACGCKKFFLHPLRDHSNTVLSVMWGQWVDCLSRQYGGSGYLWWWTSESTTNLSEVGLTLEFMDGHLHYPNDLDGPLNDPARADYNNRSSNAISFIPDITSTSGCLHSELYVLYIYTFIGKLTALFCIFRSSSCTIYQWSVPLPPCGLLCPGRLLWIIVSDFKHETIAKRNHFRLQTWNDCKRWIIIIIIWERSHFWIRFWCPD